MQRNTYFSTPAGQQQTLSGQRNQRSTEVNNQPNKGPTLSNIVLQEDFEQYGYKHPCTMLQHRAFLPATQHTFACDAEGTLFCTKCLINASNEFLCCKGNLRVAEQRAHYWLKQVEVLKLKEEAEKQESAAEFHAKAYAIAQSVKQQEEQKSQQ